MTFRGTLASTQQGSRQAIISGSAYGSRLWAENFAMGRIKEILDDEWSVVDKAYDEMLRAGGGRLATTSRLVGRSRVNVPYSKMAVLIGGGGRESTPSCFVGRNPTGTRGYS